MTDIEQIRLQAKSLGLKPHHRASAATIQKMIEAHLAQDSSDEEEPAEKPVSTDPRLAKPVIPLTAEEYRKSDAKERKRLAGRLIRCNVTCMNPEKKNWQGEIISVGSAKLGTFKKFVAFNTTEGYHIPQIIYDMLKERKCTIFVEGRDPRGNKTKVGKLINEFSIDVLPPLTPDELSDLARKQALAAGQA
jgi:hypothetical protein